MVEVTREMVEDAFRNDHAATTVPLAPRWLHTHPNDLGIILHYAEMAGHAACALPKFRSPVCCLEDFPMSLSLDDTRKVAKLARLELSADDLVRMQSQLSAILDYVKQLEELDTEGVEPLAHPLPIQNVFRPDEPTPSLSPEAALQNAPNKVGDYFAVPAVFDTDEPVSH